MQIHHISCGSFRPPLRGLTQGGGGNPLGRAQYVIHCLLIELEDRLVLVDTGLGSSDMERPLGALGWGMALFGGASAGTSALQHVARFKQSGEVNSDLEVTDIILTHLDKDHTGGLVDFAGARVHLNDLELDGFRSGPGPAGRQRYSDSHFSHYPQWVRCSEFSEDWMGLPATRLQGLPDNILLVQLPGHTLGHCGVAIEKESGWLLHAGDACYHSAWLHGKRPPLAIQWVERILMQDATAWRASLDRLVQLQEASLCTVITSHDLEMFEILRSGYTEGTSDSIT